MMNIEDFLDLVRNRRSIRVYDSTPVPDEYIGKILEAARWSMSGANAQPWEFIVIREQETKKKLAAAYLSHEEMKLKVELTRLPEYIHSKFLKTDPKNITHTVSWSSAPVVLAVLGDPRTMQASTMHVRYFEEHTFTNNMANVTGMIQLATAAMGLGSQWITIIEPVAEMMKPILGVPPLMRLFTLVPIGYPAHKPASHRRELNEIIHYEKYDMKKFRSQDDIQEFIKYLRRKSAAGKPYARQD